MGPTYSSDHYFTSNNSSNVPDYFIPVSEGPNNRTYAYCIENANNSPTFGNTTMALIKGRFTPLTGSLGEAVILDANYDAVTNSFQSGDDFYRIWIEPYTDASGFPQGGTYAPEYFTDPSVDPAGYPNYYLSKYGQSIPAGVGLSLHAYPGGICYYYLPLYNEIRDSPYTVIRNSYYRIDIQSVSGAGHPEDPVNPGEPGGPGKPDPENPVEDQNDIEASLKVSDLDPVDQPADL